MVGGDRLGRALAVRRAVVVEVRVGGSARMQAVTGHGRPPAAGRAGSAGGSKPPTDEPGPPDRHGLRRTARPLQLLLPRRRQPSRGAGRRSDPARPGRTGPDRPRRPLRCGPLRRGGPGLRPAHRLRRRAHHLRGTGGPGRIAPGPAPGCPTPTAPTWWCWPGTPRATPASAGSSPRPTWPAGRRASRSSRSTTLADRHRGHWQVLTGCRKGALATALTTEGPAAAAHDARPSDRAGSAATTWPSSSGTTAIRSTPPATTPWPCWPSSGGWPRWPPTTCTTPPRPGSPWPPRWPRCGPGGTLAELEGWLPSSATACLRG